MTFSMASLSNDSAVIKTFYVWKNLKVCTDNTVVSQLSAKMDNATVPPSWLKFSLLTPIRIEWRCIYLWLSEADRESSWTSPAEVSNTPSTNHSLEHWTILQWPNVHQPIGTLLATCKRDNNTVNYGWMTGSETSISDVILIIKCVHRTSDKEVNVL